MKDIRRIEHIAQALGCDVEVEHQPERTDDWRWTLQAYFKGERDERLPSRVHLGNAYRFKDAVKASWRKATSLTARLSVDKDA